MILSILTLLLLFVLASFGSSWGLRKMGHRVPRGLRTREDYLLFLMKLILFTIIVCVALALLLLAGYNPLKL